MVGGARRKVRGWKSAVRGAQREELGVRWEECGARSAARGARSAAGGVRQEERVRSAVGRGRCEERGGRSAERGGRSAAGGASWERGGKSAVGRARCEERYQTCTVIRKNRTGGPGATQDRHQNKRGRTERETAKTTGEHQQRKSRHIPGGEPRGTTPGNTNSGRAETDQAGNRYGVWVAKGNKTKTT